MLIFLASALVCVAANPLSYQKSNEKYSSNEYGVDKGYDTFDKSEYPAKDNGVYDVPYVPIPPGYNYENKGDCRKIKQLSVRGHRTARATFSELKRDDRTYTTISCPNSGKPYALIAEKDGADAIFNFGPGINIQDAVVLATGFNLHYSAKCHENR
ncbi:unnamed protein product [Caenorhabditis brenneri]